VKDELSGEDKGYGGHKSDADTGTKLYNLRGKENMVKNHIGIRAAAYIFLAISSRYSKVHPPCFYVHRQLCGRFCCVDGRMKAGSGCVQFS
jgi:hypothetical protein